MNDIRTDNEGHTGCYYDSQRHYINLDINDIRDIMKDLNASFDNIISRVLNHESLHHVLNKTFDKKTSSYFDSICKKDIYKNLGMW